MPISDAKLAANQRNSTLSQGPVTAFGKSISRKNALKHGLTGSGVALPSEDQQAITELFTNLQAQMRPRTDAGEQLLRRYAFLNHRVRRCERYETAELAKHVRHAIEKFDDERMAEVEALGAKLYAQPATSVRRLQMTPEGVDWLLDEWELLRADLVHPDRKCWTPNHRSHFDALMGRDAGGYRVGRIMALSEAFFGGFQHLDQADGEGLEGPERSAWAKAELTRLIDVEMGRLKEVRGRIDLDAIAADRAEAADRALFDPSPGMILARKYEAAAERAMYRALKEFRQVEADFEASGVAPCEPEEDDPVGLNLQETEDDAVEAGPASEIVDFDPSTTTFLDFSIGQAPETGPRPARHIS